MNSRRFISAPYCVYIPGAAGCASEKGVGRRHAADSVQIYLRTHTGTGASCSLEKVAHFNPEMGVILFLAHYAVRWLAQFHGSVNNAGQHGGFENSRRLM